MVKQVAAFGNAHIVRFDKVNVANGTDYVHVGWGAGGSIV